MGKVVGLKSLSAIIEKLQKKGKKVGFVTGCFDIIHISHLYYFLAAKKHVNILVVGVDNDESIKLSKGKGRPLFTLNIRSTLLSHLNPVDFVVPMEKPMIFGTDEAYEYLLELTRKISPDYLFSNSYADKYWKNVEKRADDAGCGFINLPLKPASISSYSTKIIEKLQKEL